jgi:anti-sigma factor RsiW
MTCQHTLALGAYVLDTLDLDERRRLSAHLAGCPSCRSQIEELSAPARALRSVSLADIERADAGQDGPAPDPRLLQQLLRRAAAERATAESPSGAEAPRAAQARAEAARRMPRRWAPVAVAAAAAVLLAVGATATGVALTASHDVQPTRIVATDAATHVRVEAALTATPHGTEVSVHLTGVPAGQWCRLVAVARDGRQETAATWTATYEGTAEVTGGTALQLPDIAAVRVVTADGRVLAAART